MVEGSRKRGRPKRKYIDDVKEWKKMEIDDILLEVDNRDKCEIAKTMFCCQKSFDSPYDFRLTGLK